YNWRTNNGAKFVVGGKIERIILVYSDRSIPTASWDALQKLMKSRGIQFGKMEPMIIKYSNSLEMESQLTEIFKKVKSDKEKLKKSAFIIFIDPLEDKSHDFLKLQERRYLIPTQHMTVEIAHALSTKPQCCANFVSKMNLKLGGMNYEVVPESFAQNIWISKRKTLIVGYDVAHPGKPSRDEVMNKIPPEKPSVVGFSFNGAVHCEKFIGDYHFQTPRREQVDAHVLNVRFKWMLGLFIKNRKTWPESVVITRDGVSEGQYRMVIDEELHAMKQACEEFAKLNGRDSWVPRFTVAITTKRHSARFFAKDNGSITNPKPGTVVDTEVVRNDITEFYMQSHHPVQV
ncbi:piwi domain protein, partial [Cooperia oncophora]